jgi:hypothetical protein
VVQDLPPDIVRRFNEAYGDFTSEEVTNIRIDSEHMCTTLVQYLLEMEFSRTPSADDVKKAVAGVDVNVLCIAPGKKINVLVYIVILAHHFSNVMPIDDRNLQQYKCESDTYRRIRCYFIAVYLMLKIADANVKFW